LSNIVVNKKSRLITQTGFLDILNRVLIIQKLS
jgi:hypothetical protein